ncbi:DUF2971 domain-containing protein [Salana multivorans]
MPDNTQTDLPTIEEDLAPDSEPDFWEHNSDDITGERIQRRTLFHYTDANGVIGIMTRRLPNRGADIGGVLWATATPFLNDASEIGFAFEIAAEYAEELAVDAEPKIAAGLQRFATRPLSYANRAGTYVVSFSEDGDLLSQWRAYGDYAVAFDYDALVNRLEPEWDWDRRGWRLRKCIYDPEHERRVVRNAVLRGLRDDAIKDDPDDVPTCVANAVMLVAATIKNPAFREEREWRLVLQSRDPERQKVRAGRYGIVAYTEVGLPWPEAQQVAPAVVVGPCANQDVAAAGAEALGWYGANVVQSFTVVRSSIPYTP